MADSVRRERGSTPLSLQIALIQCAGRDPSMERALVGGDEAFGVLPRVGGYAEVALIYIHQVKARDASGAEAIRDRARRRDHEPVDAPLDGVDGLQVVVAAENELGAELGEGVEGGLRVGETVAARELAPYRVVVDHDDSGGVGGGALEGLPHALDVRMLDVPDHAEILEAFGDGAPRDTVGSIQARDHRPRHLQGGGQILADELDVAGVLELVGLLAEEAAHVAPHGPEPADVVVAGDDDVGRDLPDPVQVAAGLLELPLGATLREVARDGDGVGLQLGDEFQQGLQPRGGSRAPKVEVRGVQYRGHHDGFYPNGSYPKTRRAHSSMVSASTPKTSRSGAGSVAYPAASKSANISASSSTAGAKRPARRAAESGGWGT